MLSALSIQKTDARTNAWRMLRIPLQILLIASGTFLFFLHQIEPFFKEQIYNKDFVAIYSATREFYGEGKYNEKLTVLSQKYVHHQDAAVFDYPSPHPPTMALLLFPLVFFEYPAAKAVWLGVEIACWFAFIRFYSGFTWWNIFLLFLALQFWEAFTIELLNGQCHFPLLLLIGCSLMYLCRDRENLAGLFLGLSFLLKPLFWPVLFSLFLYQKYRAILASLAMLLAGHILVAYRLGGDFLIQYYSKTLAEVAAIFRDSPINLSLWTFGQKIFGGTGIDSPSSLKIQSTPLWDSPLLDSLFTYLIPVIAFAYFLYAAYKVNNLFWAFLLMVTLSLVISPFSWSYYLVIALLPIFAIGRRLSQCSLSREIAFFFPSSLLLLFIGLLELKSFSVMLSGESNIEGQILSLSFWSYTPFFLHTAGVLLLCFVILGIAHQERKEMEYS